MIVAEYMERMCVCGTKRSHHAHAWTGGLAGHGKLRVVGVLSDCDGFLDAIEMELGGNPLANKHLGPLMREGD